MTNEARALLAATLTLAILTGAACSTAGTQPAAPAPAVTTEVYPVKDLVSPTTRFQPPAVRDLPRVEVAAAEASYIRLDDLVANLVEATDPGYWKQDGVGICAEEGGFLSVKASPKMQQQVAQVLADMRLFAAAHAARR